MPLRLRVIPSGRSKGRAHKPLPGERAIEFDDGVGQIRIGRRADLELSLPFSPLSGVHARLVRASGEAGAGGHAGRPLAARGSGEHQRYVRWRRAAEARRQAGADRGDADRAGAGEVDLRRRGARDGGDGDVRAAADRRPAFAGAGGGRGPVPGGGQRRRRLRDVPVRGAKSPLRHRTRQVVRLPHQGCRGVARARGVHVARPGRRAGRPRRRQTACTSTASGYWCPGGSTTGTWCRSGR